MQDFNPLRNNRALATKEDILDLGSNYGPNPQSYYGDNYYGNKSEGNEKQQIFKILSGLKKHWLKILAINLLITSLVIVYEAQKPDYYTAETRIQVNNETNPAAGTIVISNTGNDPTYFSTQLQIIEGSGLLRRVVKSTDLENNEAFLRPNKNRDLTTWQNVKRMFGIYHPSQEENNPSIVETNGKKNELNLKKENELETQTEIEELAPYVAALQSRMKVAPVKDNRTVNKETRLIDIEFTHNDPVVAAKLVNAIAETYVLQNLEQKVQTNADAGDFLQKRVAELQSLIRSGEERLINYGKSNQILSLDAGQNTVVQRLADLNAKLGQAENDRIVAQAAYQAALKNPLSNTTAELKDARTTGLESQLTVLRQQLTQLKTEYTEEWDEVKKVRKQIEGLEKELQNTRKVASSSQTATLEQAFRETAAREKELRSNFDKQRSEVLAQNEAAINYRIIQQEIETNKTLLNSVLQKSKETDIILNETPNNVRLVDRALVPNFPTGPKRFTNVIFAFMSSLMVGICLALVLNWLNDTINNVESLEDDTGLPVLGLIPSPPVGFIRGLLPKRLVNGKNKLSSPESYHLERFEEPVIKESYLSLRTSLLLSTAGGAPKVILVTSGQPGEGKTITAINTAKSLAQTGSRVLLIDADLRYPRLHTVNQIPNHKGLSNLITVKEINSDLLDSTIQKNLAENLDILTAGPNVPNPVNLLGSKEMKRLLAVLKGQYSHIVIDSPPVLYFADSSILSTYADAVVLIARYNVSTKQSILHTKKKLQDVSAKIIGIVFNCIPINGLTYNNYGYYNRLEISPNEDEGILHLK